MDGPRRFREPTELGGGASWRHALHGARLMELLAPDAWAAGVGHRARAEHYSMAYQESPFHLLLGHYDVVVRSSLTSFSPSPRFFPFVLFPYSVCFFCSSSSCFLPAFLSFRSILLPACLSVLPDLFFFPIPFVLRSPVCLPAGSLPPFPSWCLSCSLHRPHSPLLPLLSVTLLRSPLTRAVPACASCRAAVSWAAAPPWSSLAGALPLALSGRC